MGLPFGAGDDTNFHSWDTDLKGHEDWEAQEKPRNDALTDRPSISPKGSESGPPCSNAAKCHGQCSGYSNLRAASHYPCFNYECTNLEAATLDKLDAQRRADALLHPKYRSVVTPDPLSADQPLTADLPRCPDCLDQHKIKMLVSRISCTVILIISTVVLRLKRPLILSFLRFQTSMVWLM